MKRLSSDERITWILLSKRRGERRLISKNKKRSARKPSMINKAPITRIQAPLVFGLRNKNNHNKLIQFISKIKTTIFNKKQRVNIDFSQTKQMIVCGTLHFFTELKQIKNDLGSLKLISCNQPKDDTVAQVLQHLGILQMLGCSCSIEPDLDNVINWNVAFGKHTDTTEVGKILEGQSSLAIVKSKKIYRGVSEAMTNVSQHAYIQIMECTEKALENKGWCMFYQEESERIFIAFCDLGVGIPVTLPYTVKKNNETGFLASILKRLSAGRKKHSDGELIQAAIELKRSRTKKIIEAKDC